MPPRVYSAIGRARDNDVVLDHPTVSNHHARLSWAGASLIVEDLSSEKRRVIGEGGAMIASDGSTFLPWALALAADDPTWDRARAPDLWLAPSLSPPARGEIRRRGNLRRWSPDPGSRGCRAR